MLKDALFKNRSPNRVWGDVLLATGSISGRLEEDIPEMWAQVLRGNEASFSDWSANRSAGTVADGFRGRNVALLLSNNLEDRLFEPDDMLNFFQAYMGPKKMLLNQGIHASAEMSSLFGMPDNYVWKEVKTWLDRWLKKRPPTNGSMTDDALVTVQVRSDMRIRESFAEWPGKHVKWIEYGTTPRRLGLHGSLVPRLGTILSTKLNERHTQDERVELRFARLTGLTLGAPVVGEVLQVYTDMRIVSNLLIASTMARSHAIWYHAPVRQRSRICGTPTFGFDVSSESSSWQIVAYLFSVDWLYQGTLISHGSFTCWNCTPSTRYAQEIKLRTLCEDVQGGIALALSLYSDMYKPANTHHSLRVRFHYSKHFSLRIPFLSSPFITSAPDLQVYV